MKLVHSQFKGMWKMKGVLALTVCLVFGCGGAPVDDTIDVGAMRSTASGLKYKDKRVGVGSEPKAGETCVMEYSGWLWENGKKGKSIGSSRGRKPYRYEVGSNSRMIKGTREGIASMKPGGRRLLLIPPSLAYGEKGSGNGMIPPNATLLCDVELITIEK